MSNSPRLRVQERRCPRQVVAKKRKAGLSVSQLELAPIPPTCSPYPPYLVSGSPAGPTLPSRNAGHVPGFDITMSHLSAHEHALLPFPIPHLPSYPGLEHGGFLTSDR